MSKPTEHGEHIAGQIQGEDAYGCSGTLTLADVWHIIDNLDTHWLDTNRKRELFQKWLRELEEIDEDLP